MKKWMILVAVLGCFGLLAALHHVVVLTARGTQFAGAFQSTCSWCHGGKYDGWNERAE